MNARVEGKVLAMAGRMLADLERRSPIQVQNTRSFVAGKYGGEIAWRAATYIVQMHQAIGSKPETKRITRGPSARGRTKLVRNLTRLAQDLV